MNQSRKTWASAAVVGVILVGGASVAAAATSGRLARVGEETRAVVEKAKPSETPTPGSTDGIVVSHEINPDPEKVLDYWTDKRLQDAEPMPMPEGNPGEFHIAE
ncbi:hypothetical protein ABT294_14325 [Nonomuraea sp. NPDC000554]|uniref:hypothetical protein n=1 Tax=Nonomuraea sp. NPDC000554 TaxID=3154259 RepID=UPI0033203875